MLDITRSLFVCTMFALTAPVAAQVHFRPISDLLQHQGTYVPDPSSGCIPTGSQCLWFPPAPNYIGWGSATDFGLVDYAGLANAHLRTASSGAIDLNTQVNGFITEQLMGDGRALVDIYLATTNALAFGLALANWPSPLSFGANAGDVLLGATPAVGSYLMHLTMLNPGGLGAPLPDLVQSLNWPTGGQQLIAATVVSQSFGTLHAASGFPEGTPGRMRIVQNAHLNPSTNTLVWTAEIVTFTRHH